MADDYVVVVPLDSSGLHYELLVLQGRVRTGVRVDLDPHTRLVATAQPALPGRASPQLLRTLPGTTLSASVAHVAATAAEPSPASAGVDPTAAAALARDVAALGPGAVVAVAPDCASVTLRALDRAGTPHTGVLHLAPHAAFETRELPRDVCDSIAAAAAASAGGVAGSGVAAAARAFSSAVMQHEGVWAELDALDALQARWSGESGSRSESAGARGVLRRSLDVTRGALLTVALCAARPRVRPVCDVDGAAAECARVRECLEQHQWDANRSVAENIAAALAPLRPPVESARGNNNENNNNRASAERPLVQRGRECALCMDAESPDGAEGGADCVCDGCGAHYHRFCLQSLPNCESKAGTHTAPCSLCQKPILF